MLGSAIRSLIGRIGAGVIHGLIALLGRTHRRADVPWLAGPVGGAVIGDAPYQDVATREGLGLERPARHGGLVPDFEALRGATFDPDAVHPLIRDFYEHTIGVRDGRLEPVLLPARASGWACWSRPSAGR